MFLLIIVFCCNSMIYYTTYILSNVFNYCPKFTSDHKTFDILYGWVHHSRNPAAVLNQFRVDLGLSGQRSLWIWKARHHTYWHDKHEVKVAIIALTWKPLYEITITFNFATHASFKRIYDTEKEFVPIVMLAIPFPCIGRTNILPFMT